MSYKDYYRVLRVERDASAEDIQRSYRRLARQYHPDVSKEPDAEARFKEIQEAHEVLKDPDKRRLYDKWGSQWKAISEGRTAPGSGPGSAEFRFDFGPFGASGGSMDDLRSMFEQVFHGQQRPRRRRPSGTRANDQETVLELPLLAAFRGGARDIQYLDTTSGEKKRLTVSVPPGVRDGQRIRLQGQGAGGADLYLRVKVTSDGRFRLDGDDVHTVLKVSPAEAALGATAPLSTLEGRVKIRVPAGSSSGRQIRLRERGYPGRGGRRGDFFAEIQIVVPAALSEEEKALYEKLAEISRFDPREGAS